MPHHRSPRVVIIGSSNTDLVLRCVRLPRPGETVLGGGFARHAGGKGANQAVAAARAGARVVFVGARGNDDFGRAACAGLRREGIDVRAFRVRDGDSSGVALIMLGGRDRQNLIAVARSANDTVSPADVRAVAHDICAAGAVVAQLEVPLAAVRAAADLAAAAGVPFVLNPAPSRPLSAALLRRIHTLTPNEREATELAGGRMGARQAARWLRAQGCRNVVVTLGARGALVVEAGGETLVPAPKVEPLDTVGAGDCFTAWLAVGLAEGLPLCAAAVRAVRAAALSVTRSGAQSGMPHRREVV